MMDFFGLFKNKNKGSKNTAKERLQLVLVHDRAGVSPELLEQLKGEIMAVISKYIEIEQDEFDIQVTKTRTGDGERYVPMLAANIPINKMKAPPKVEPKEEPQEEIKEDVAAEEPTEATASEDEPVEAVEEKND